MKSLMLAGLAVLATPAVAQTSAPMPAAPMSSTSSMPAAMPADGAYPMCSRGVTDHCMEHSNAKGERMHMMHPMHRKHR